MSEAENTSPLVMKLALEAYLEGELPEEDVLALLNREIANAKAGTLPCFIPLQVRPADVNG